MLTIKIPSILFAEIEKEKKKKNWIHMDQQKSRTTKVLLSKSNKLCTSHFLLSEYHGKVTTFKLQPNRKQESHVGQRNWVEPRKRAAHLWPTDSWWGGNQRGRGHSFSGWHWENSIYVFTPMNASGFCLRLVLASLETSLHPCIFHRLPLAAGRLTLYPTSLWVLSGPWFSCSLFP